MPKRLLIVTQHFWPENFRINDMVDGFLADGIVVDILCGLPNYPHGEWFDGYTAHGPFAEDYHGANVYRCREIARKGNTSLRIFLNYISFPITAACSLHRLAGNYDAVLCYNTSPVLMSFPAILAARKFNAPLTNYVLDIWPENLYSVLNIQNAALRKIASAVSDWHYRRADRLIAMNEGLKERLQARVGNVNAKSCREKRKQYAVIPQYCEDFYDSRAGQGDALQNSVPQSGISQGNAPQDGATCTGDHRLPLQSSGILQDSTDLAGGNTPPLQSVDATQNTANDSIFNIQFAGNFSPAQSLDTVIAAMAIVNAQTPSIHLTLIGDGMSRIALQTEVQQRSLAHCVHFHNSVSATEIPALAAQADALIIPLSSTADLGLTIPAKFASCMAAGKPLLVSLDGEGARVARESGGALVSPAANAEALAQNILTLAAMPSADRTTMGDAAYTYYKTHFSRAKLLQEIEDFIF